MAMSRKYSLATDAEEWKLSALQVREANDNYSFTSKLHLIFTEKQ